MVPDDDQAMVLPCTSVMVIMVLLNEALTCATPEAMFLRSRRRTRVASLPILNPSADRHRPLRHRHIDVLLDALISSFRRWPWPDLFECGRWCGCAGRAPAGRGDDAGRDS